jgi:hypothetical protein
MTNQTPPELAQLQKAQAEFTDLVSMIPYDALDWQPAGNEWPLRETIAHVAHAYDFYSLILNLARASNFTTVTMYRDLPGWQALRVTDAAIKACHTSDELLAAFNQAFAKALTHFQTITPEELDIPFTYDHASPDEAPYTTTLRHRILEKATEHAHEHIPQITNTLAQWRRQVKQESKITH